MQKGRSSLCRVGERANKSHGIIIRQHAGKKEGGIYFENKKETKKAVELPARPFASGGNAAGNEPDGVCGWFNIYCHIHKWWKYNIYRRSYGNRGYSIYVHNCTGYRL